MKLDDLALFLAVVRCGSFTLAAKQKTISSSTLSRRIQQLEQDIGSILLIRNSKEIVLTKEGEHLFDTYAELFAELENKQDQALRAKREYRGDIVINAPIIPIRHQLSPLALEFCQQHPKVNINIQVGAGMDYFTRHDLDIALRFGPQPQSEWVARKLASNPSLLCASAAYAHSLNLQHPEQLLSLPLLTLNTKQAWVFLHTQSGERFQFMPKPRLGSEELDTIINATLMDMGVARLPKGLITQEVNLGKLVPLLPEWQMEGADVYLLHPQRRFLPERTQALIDYIITHWSRVAFSHWLT
ncbi:LysR family transcriptional regulator [Vibrio cincinnatiensis]|jgi:DNA-binding transcriptional LysR family regulator|uniref:DNA-binding transcriptional regulator, LysR family n=1 Tax=Vibrio cincinnatiensis DSM 19608 TaxID=1123491 RepID=A0A1T4RJ05_VIBCI|nr:LysR family transcriptional regulator [Vibrio cincinnatiensis]MCG3721300.1 LysR family transcriptional regulator [Vibrio cincinnatiensis]MCG3725649.1 LysR family transcriptional regulator [Vibrio cincinnatiensis]MCG3732026.1 LysR family transcriptional regulator [Vibrio cincinnatiensis]MCG3737410.1 LysR family transcriptional regulator [Vibrio cincinnatiensis]MCG3739737.1 LysR family transcriptional regulator [Vibrio cincinnatiensis]